MKNKTGFILFIAICLILCAVPSVCMIFARSDKAIGNETSVELPAFRGEDGAFNANILSELGDYFETHYAFRPQLITADAILQKNLFQVSNAETVVTGTDGWLYYSSTVNDYLGREQLSERGMENVAHNVRLLQDYAEGQGASFLFLVPPNKNSLYGEHMPYYDQQKAGQTFNRDRLKEKMEKAGVRYLDVFSLFQKEEEILYLKQDSHWNNKGACMVYNSIEETLGKEHETYSNVPVVYSKSHSGDLSEMLYPGRNDPEMDYVYEYEPAYRYVPSPLNSDPVSVEDFRIETVNEEKSGSLLMYRDSFGNTLLPFLAEEYGSAFFTKATPYILSLHMKQYHPDTVILEKVERNLRDFAEDPGVIPSPAADVRNKGLYLASEGESEVSACDADMTFLRISGVLPKISAAADAKIYVQVTDPLGNEEIYEAFTLTIEGSDYGYAVYLPLEMFGTVESVQKERIKVYIEN